MPQRTNYHRNPLDVFNKDVSNGMSLFHHCPKLSCFPVQSTSTMFNRSYLHFTTVSCRCKGFHKIQDPIQVRDAECIWKEQLYCNLCYPQSEGVETENSPAVHKVISKSSFRQNQTDCLPRDLIARIAKTHEKKPEKAQHLMYPYKCG